MKSPAATVRAVPGVARVIAAVAEEVEVPEPPELVAVTVNFKN
jgi:hypothetical protein